MHLCCCWFVVIHVEFTWTAINFLCILGSNNQNGAHQHESVWWPTLCSIFCFFGESTILHQVMIVFIETLSLHVIFLLIPPCRTKNKGNKRSLWRRGMLKLPPSSSLYKLNLLYQYFPACYCSIWKVSTAVQYAFNYYCLPLNWGNASYIVGKIHSLV